MNKLLFLLTLFAILAIAYSEDDDSNLPNTVDMKDPTKLDENDPAVTKYDTNEEDDDDDDDDNDEAYHGVGPAEDDHAVGEETDSVSDDDDLDSVPSTISTKSQEFVDACLAHHNNYRAEVNLAPLKWNDDLASGSADWSIKIGGDGKLSHSHGPYGENTACGTTGSHNIQKLHELWGKEKQWFKPGKDFPDVATNGDWHTVGHYSQIVWSDTTEVGCGVSVQDGWAWLTCRYLPQGNIRGQKPY